jgi:ABC-type nickel/cobalt efflux system permease component RcnA
VLVLVPIVIALLLGLRHAADPDHLAAVSTLLLNQEENGSRRAARLGLAWGLGHATTLLVFGLPVVWFSAYLPEAAQRGAEVLIGGLIVGLAVRLLVRWRRGHFHVHLHRHGSIRHIHGHTHRDFHDDGEHPTQHTHAHTERLGRSPAASFGIGLVHGMGGSAGAGVLLMGAVSGKAQGVLALLVFAAATAASMSVLSAAFAHTLSRNTVRRRLSDLIPVVGTAGVLFGAWYSLGALQGGI